MKKLLPKRIVEWIVKIKYKRKKSEFKGKSTKETFTQIFNTNHWEGLESISGRGSDKSVTDNLGKEITKILLNFEVKSILDLPCGDFKWMKDVDLNGAQYTGGDIVKKLIDHNKIQYKSKNATEFRIIDMIKDDLPYVDLILVRDCFVHLSFEHIYASLKNIINSESKYILTTSFPLTKLNFDIVTGDWRTLNLCRKPFSFPEPLLIISEFNSKKDNRDKSLMLWKIKDLPNV